jgi:hypothetical protein
MSALPGVKGGNASRGPAQPGAEEAGGDSVRLVFFVERFAAQPAPVEDPRRVGGTEGEADKCFNASGRLVVWFHNMRQWRSIRLRFLRRCSIEVLKERWRAARANGVLAVLQE